MIQGIKRFAPEISQETSEKLERYISLLRKWNEKINLTASNDISLLEPMLLEGVWASGFYPLNAAKHLDIGSGAGFPAIPMRIMSPNIQLDIIESRLKRVLFLETVANELNLSDTRVFHGRNEQFLDRNIKQWDCISWKGLKISTKDLLKLKAHSHETTHFFIFHGKELAVENPEFVQKEFHFIRSEKYPYKSDWLLSIYCPR